MVVRTTKLTQFALLAVCALVSHAEASRLEESNALTIPEQAEVQFVNQFAADLRRELGVQHFSVQEAAMATDITVQRSRPAALKKLQWTGSNVNALLVNAIQSGCVVKLESRNGQILAAGFEFWCP